MGASNREGGCEEQEGEGSEEVSERKRGLEREEDKREGKGKKRE